MLAKQGIKVTHFKKSGQTGKKAGYVSVIKKMLYIILLIIRSCAMNS